jgi:hypothetical protein
MALKKAINSASVRGKHNELFLDGSTTKTYL